MERLACVREVFLVSCNPGGVASDQQHPITKIFGIPSIGINDAVAQLDVIIELGIRLDQPVQLAFRGRGGRLVSYVAGNIMAMNLEAVSSGLPYGEAICHAGFDAAWVTPQHLHTNYSYCKLTRSQCVYEAPHLWDSAAIKISRVNHPHPFAWKASNVSQGWKLATFEPNINFIKTFHLPLLVCENAERIHPGLIEHLFLMNTESLKGQNHFEGFVAATNLGRAGKVSAESRIAVTEILGQHAYAVVAHQWENSLNYNYWDVLYGGFPLIHNSGAFKEVGYYYPDFDPQEGGRVLVDALLNHGTRLNEYKSRASQLLWKFSVDNPDVQRKYHDLLQLLFK
jgi:hypothetical protein